MAFPIPSKHLRWLWLLWNLDIKWEILKDHVQTLWTIQCTHVVTFRTKQRYFLGEEPKSYGDLHRVCWHFHSSFHFWIFVLFPSQPHLNHSREMKLSSDFIPRRKQTVLRHLAWGPRVVTAHSSSFSVPWAADLNTEFTWTSKEAGRMEFGASLL